MAPILYTDTANDHVVIIIAIHLTIFLCDCYLFLNILEKLCPQLNAQEMFLSLSLSLSLCVCVCVCVHACVCNHGIIWQL